MEASFWLWSWESREAHTCFYRNGVHPFVTQHMSPETIEGKTILVPLCGKGDDLLYLARFANKVIGVEIAETPIMEFCCANKLRVVHPDANTYVSGNITIYRRDFMEMTAGEIGPVDWVLDRVSLTSLPHSMRISYLETIERLTTVGTRQLLISMEFFPQVDLAPFSITPGEVLSYYGKGHVVKHIETQNLPKHGMVRRRKLSYLAEHGFLLTKYANGRMMKTRHVRVEIAETRVLEMAG